MAMNDYTDPIDLHADVLDTRDIIARIDWLDRQGPEDEDGNPIPNADGTPDDGLTDDERDELATLVKFRDEHSGDIADWEYGETLIADRYFEDYARELASDIGAINADAQWPLMHIDWEAAASSLQQDYTDVTLDGRTYWAR